MPYVHEFRGRGYNGDDARYRAGVLVQCDRVCLHHIYTEQKAIMSATFEQHIDRVMKSVRASMRWSDTSAPVFAETLTRNLNAISMDDIDEGTPTGHLRFYSSRGRTHTSQPRMGRADSQVIAKLVDITWPDSHSIDDAISATARYLELSYLLAKEYSTRYSRTTWDNVLLLLVSTPEYRDIIETFTVDGEALVPLIVSLIGNASA
ncbi:MAG: hypothetical protein E6R04_04610 [Spirochaetes bacterium]|nr:MAG: hypothetical protein E6R04_04610 [Spirochaetota bacterium]